MGEFEFMKQNKIRYVQIAVGLILLGMSAYLLRDDIWTFWSWWLLAGVLGMAAMPLTGRLFDGFEDRGWIFSKILAIALTGFSVWFVVSIGILPFRTWVCIAAAVLLVLICFGIFVRDVNAGKEYFPVGGLDLVIWEELLFFAVFLLWTYLAGFHPQAYGTEKFMDYGFMEAMMRSTGLPATDMWYSEGKINYYYGGQYFAVFLTKLTGSQTERTYNLMRSFVAAFAFAMPFSLVYQMVTDRCFGRLRGRKRLIPAAAGMTAGVAVCIAGNMHYVFYAKVLPFVYRLLGKEWTGSYWFPDSTRYIGYDPDVPDKTIHEFPCYSFVLGDLHAHVVNIMFVLLMVGILYAWMKMIRKKSVCEGAGISWKTELLQPHILLGSLLLGMYRWTNFWDFVIYFVVMGGVVLFANVIRFAGKSRKVLLVTAAQAAEVLVISTMVILPFTLQFKTMVDGVAFARNHSLLRQLLILWGLPVILFLLFLGNLLYEKRRVVRKKKWHLLFQSVSVPDLFAVITGLCAMGLVLIPELVYVRDIYEDSYARANTMFKLTYQAFILFGITMGYILIRMIFMTKRRLVKTLSWAGMALLLCTVGYFGNSVSSWYGNVLEPSGYQGLNSLTFLDTDFPEDADAIYWLKKNVEGSPVVLEANGDSYTGYGRVSATTGLPTILGWYVHEWLWRNDIADLNQKAADIETIYTSEDREQIQELLEQYQVSYIFIGSTEREKYRENLKTEVLKSLGTVVFQDETYDTCIIKIEK